MKSAENSENIGNSEKLRKNQLRKNKKNFWKNLTNFFGILKFPPPPPRMWKNVEKTEENLCFLLHESFVKNIPFFLVDSLILFVKKHKYLCFFIWFKFIINFKYYIYLIHLKSLYCDLCFFYVFVSFT